MKRIFAFIMGTTVGALLGVALVIFLTPQSGEDIRELFRERFLTLQNDLKSAASTRKIELERQISSLRQPK